MVVNFIEGTENTGTWQFDIAGGLMIAALDALSADCGAAVPTRPMHPRPF